MPLLADLGLLWSGFKYQSTEKSRGIQLDTVDFQYEEIGRERKCGIY